MHAALGFAFEDGGLLSKNSYELNAHDPNILAVLSLKGILYIPH